MKKLVAFILSLMMLCSFALAETQDWVGTWTMVKAIGSGIELNPSQTGVSMTFELKADGVMNGVVNNLQGIGTWKLDGDKIVMTSGNQDMVFTIEGEVFYLEQSNVKMYFERTEEAVAVEGQAPDLSGITAGEAPAQIVAQAREEFNGSWGNAFMVVNGIRMPLAAANMTSGLVIDDTMCKIEINGVEMTSPIPFVDGVLTISSGSNTITIALNEGGMASMTTNGQTFYYEQLLVEE